MRHVIRIKTSTMTDRSYPDYIHKKNFLSDIKPDQTILFRKDIIPLLPGIKKDVKELFIPSPVRSVADDFDEWYPAVNSYYPFTEDVDAFARVHHLLESKKSSDSVEKDHTQCINEYGDKRAHHQYLRSKPTCFLILGKPGLEERELGKRLANYWKCVYIDPLTLLTDEISTDSRPGQCIEFNLRCGRAMDVDVLLRLLARRVQNQDVLHRGFVCCGFPLIPNDLYEEDPISSESAVFNVREIFDEIIDHTLLVTDVSMNVAVSMVDSSMVESEVQKEEKTEELEEVASNSEAHVSMEWSDWSMHSQVCGPTDISTDLEKQLNCIFGLFQNPFFIIYLHGRNSDVVSKRDNYYFDIYSNKTLDMLKIKMFYDVGAANEDLTDDLFGEGRNPFANNPTLRHIVKHPENLPANVSTQLNRYYNEIVNTLDYLILQHEQKYYIKLDSRCFISQMLNLIKLRLKVLPVHPVLIPQEFSFSVEEVGEGSPKEIEDAPEEAFLKLRRQDIISPVFKWVWSDWGPYCPVSMSEGHYQKGSSKYAAHFTNRIYLMTNETNYHRFLENPRPFLLPPFPKPGSNILVFGPPVSGKSAVAKCLGYLLHSKVLTSDEMHREYLAQAFVEFQEKVKQGAIAEAMEILKEKHMAVLQDKQQNIINWEDETRKNLRKLGSLLDQRIKKTGVISSFPMMMEQDVMDVYSVNEEQWVRERLGSLNIPTTIDKEFCEQLLEHHDALYQYLPSTFKEQAEEDLESPSVHDPFVLEYAEEKVNQVRIEDVKNKVKENIYDMYARSIRAVDDTEYYGWVIDGMTPDVGLIQQLSEEFQVHEIIILTSSDYQFLTDRFKEGDKHKMQYRDFRNFFLRIKERDVAYRAPSFLSTASFKKEMAEDIVSTMLGACFDEDALDQERGLSTLQYQGALEVYEREIEEVLSGLDELQRHYIVIDAKNLSIEELLEVAFYSVQDKYRRPASEFTDDDRAEEVQQFMAETIPAAEGEGGDQVGDDLIAKNRRYGDMYYYCPVAFSKKFVLKRGKEEFAAKFKDKIYMCGNENNFRDFIRFPRKHLLQISPPDRYPPPRICVIGVNAEMREIIGKKLATNLGVRYIDFANVKMQAINMLSYTSLLVDPEGEDLPDTLLYHWYDVLLGAIWFEEPYKYAGFVIHGFPVKPRCLNYMLTMDAVPDLIIHVALSREENLKRQLAKFMNEWREDAETQRKQDEVINSIILQEWEDKRKARYNELMEIKRQNRYSNKIKEEGIEPSPLEDETELNTMNFASDTQISIDSVIEQQEHDETMRILDKEFSEPVFEESQEAEEIVVERFTAEIEQKYDTFMEYYEEIKKVSEAEIITFAEIDGDQDLEKVMRHAYIAGNEVKFRGEAIFERCYDVSLDLAEKLLAVGYYFLSSFGRLCPVAYSDGQTPLHMYIANEQNNNLYPMIHRQHIYFLNGKKNRAMFIKNPLRYTTTTNFDFPLIQLRVAVIGPPKSGKSTLANRFYRELGFRLLSRGQAIRYVLKNPLYTNLLNLTGGILRKGEALTDEMVMDCVQAESFCGHAVTQGLIFDGFPNSIKEMNLLSKLGMVPHLIFDLQITKEQLHRQAAEPNNKDPQFSERFIDHLYTQWSESQKFFREWCDREYQNISKINVDRSIWGMWNHAKQITLSFTFERRHYFKCYSLDWPLRLATMLVTPLEFLERQGQYGSYCPACFFYTRKLMNGGDPPDRTGLVQYGKKFYWLCEEHIEIFLKSPDQFLPPSNLLLPPHLPQVVAPTVAPEHLAENGYCLTCYQENFPRKVLVQGSLEFVVLYKDVYYMFDSLKCLSTFMAYPTKFCNLIIHFKDDDSSSFSLKYRDLPVLGMLEQYVSRNIIKAVNNVNVTRPVIPGLSISQAALIFVGLKLKVDNSKTANMKKYENGLQRFQERMSNLQRYLGMMKTYLNPLVYYEEPDTPSSTEVEVDSDEEKAMKLSKVYSTMI